MTPAAPTDIAGAGTDHLHQALRASGVGLWTWRIADGLVTWTPGCYEILGLDEPLVPLTLATFQAFIHPDDASAFQAQVDEALRLRARFDSEFRIVRPDGAVRVLSNQGQVETGPDGLPWRMLGSVRDITEHKQAQAAGRRHAERLQAIWKQSPVGLAEFSLDGRLMQANERFCALLGLPESALRGRRHADLLFPGESLPHDGSHPVGHAELRYLGSDGSPVWVELTASLVLSDEGTPRTVMAVAIDIAERKKTEERLHLSVEVSETGLWTWDVLTGAVTWTSNCYLIHGLQPSEFDGTAETFFKLIHPEDAARVERTVREAIAAHRLYECEFRIVRPDGGVAWVANRGRARYSDTGEPLSVLGTIVDVTPRREAEQAMQVALEASRTGTFRWDMRTDALTWDGALDKLFGLQPGELVRDLQNFIDRVHPDDRDGVIERCRRCRDEAVDFDMEYRIVHPDGSVHWMYDRGRTFVDSTGRAQYMTGAVVHIDGRKRAELALQQREQELRAVTDNSPDLIARFDRRLRHVFVNPAVARATGRPMDDLRGRTLRDIGMPPALCTQWEDGLRQVFESGQPHRMPFQLELEGKQRHFSCQLTPEFDPAGQLDTVLGIARDITDAWNAHEALRQADRQKDEFLATLAHELRNPLAPLRTGLDLLLRRGAANAEDSRVCKIMSRQLDQLVRLVDELLDVARISQGKVMLRQAPVALQSIVELAVDGARPVFAVHRQELVVHDIPRDWLVFGDEARLGQVVGNLLNNAAKYTPAQGRITISAEASPDELCLTVADSGVGIAPDMLERVFDRFVQAPQHLHRAQGGLGIGLSVVRTLVDMHGGRVVAQSDGPGLGSRFRVWLPRAWPVRAGATPSDQPRGAARRLNVLVVDDNADAAETLGMMIALEDHEVRVAHDGPSALQLAAQSWPDVVFLDIGMPGMSGHELTRRLRAEPSTRECLIVALTGWGSEDDRRRSREAGCDLHLTKPVDLDAVGKVLAGQFPRRVH